MIIEILQETIKYFLDIDMKLDINKKLSKEEQKTIAIEDLYRLTETHSLDIK